MDTKEIDEIFKAFEDNDIERILKYSNKSISLEETEALSESQQEDLLKEILKNVMYKIESDDNSYNYFSSKNENEVYFKILAHTKKHVKDIEKIIDSIVFSELFNNDKIELIKATGKVEE